MSIYNMNWLELTELSQIEEIIEFSNEKPILVFKHSTRCGISRFALNSFQRSYNLNEDEMTSYILDLIKHRNISNSIAEKFEVQHQSPQAIVILKGEIIYTASHGDISFEDIKKAID